MGMKKLISMAYPPPKKEKQVKGADTREVTPARLDLRIGKITSVEMHPDAESLFVETIDVGEEKPRTAVSGLREYMTAEQLNNRFVVLLCNLKPQKMRGILSEAMLLAASKTNMSGTREVIPLLPPPGCQPGDRVTVQGFSHAEHGDPDEQLNPRKKIFETLKTDLLVSDASIAEFKGQPLQTDIGVITSALQNAE